MTIQLFSRRRLSAALAASALLGTLCPAATFAQAPAPLLDRVSSAPVPDPREQVLAAGDPALTEAAADKVTAFFGWLLDAPLTDAQRHTLRAGMISTWKKGDKAGIRNALGMASTYDTLAGYGEARRAFVRAQYQPQFLAGLRANAAKDETSRWLLGVYQAAHRPLAPGEPPLTREASDSLAEVLCFMVNETQDGQRLAADARFKEACARSLVAGYPKAGEAQRQYLAKMPLFWAALRVAWPQLTEDQRAGYRRQFAVALKSLLPPVQTAARAQPSAGPQAPPLTEAERRRRSQVVYQRLMLQMQMRHNLFMGMSGAMMQQHWNTMNAIGNMGGSGGTYVNPQTGTAY